MVYDQARNFLGDTYYKDSNELFEGDELSLDKGVMVEVAEAIGVTQTDLTVLFEKKPKDQPPPPPPLRPSVTSQTRPFQRPSQVTPNNIQRSDSQLRHKSLNTLLGTPKGPIGKAQPIKSPYEARKEKENDVVQDRPSKRQKIDQSIPAWRASSPAQEPSPDQNRLVQPVARINDVGTSRKPARFVPPSATVITIDSEPETLTAITSDLTLPDTPPRVKKANTQPLPAPQSVNAPVSPQQERVLVPKIPRGKVPLPEMKSRRTPKHSVPPSSPPVSATNRISNIDPAVQSTRLPQKQPSPPPNPKAKSLRLSSGVKRGTLLCQSLPHHASRVVGRGRTAEVRKTSRSAWKDKVDTLSPSINEEISHDEQSFSISSTSESRGTHIRLEVENAVNSKRARRSQFPPRESLEEFDDPDLVHGLMDEPLLMNSSQQQLPGATASVKQSSEDICSESVDQRQICDRIRTLDNTLSTEDQGTRRRGKGRSPTGTVRLPRGSKALRQQATDVELESPLVPALIPPVPLSQEASPSHSNASEIQSRASSTSPGKKLLSTGGFHKKSKPKNQASTMTTATETAAVAVAAETVQLPSTRNDTITLPPHPLRAAKKGPLMSTTELAALLQKPKRKQKPSNDVIEDEGSGTGAGTGKSPNRNFRRVRSENDAPIPSLAEDWERRNLSKTSSTLTDVTDPCAETSVAVIVPQEPVKKKVSGLSALIRKTDPRRKLQRTQSMSVNTNVSTTVDPEPTSPVVDKDVGPWSTEAFDLFDWRPPGREPGGAHLE